MESARGFQGKVGIVVGGASGMGNAVVRQLTREGVRTHVFDIKPTADGVFQSCDVRDYDQVRRSVQQVLAQEGRIDLLFIAAGVHLFANIEDTSIEEFERVLAINLKGPFYVLKEVLPVMRQQRSGNVVIMGSDQVFVGKGSSAVYGLSKAALGQLTKSTAIDYAPTTSASTASVRALSTRRWSVRRSSDSTRRAECRSRRSTRYCAKRSRSSAWEHRMKSDGRCCSCCPMSVHS